MAFYHCLLFDVDGTLLDFHASEDAAIRETLAYFSLPNDETAIEKYRTINDSLWGRTGARRDPSGKVGRSALCILFTGIRRGRRSVKINDHYLTTLSEHAETFPERQTP